MNERDFDVAVITEGINGLLSAFEVARNGGSVIVIDNYNPSFEIDGYIFDYYPEHLFSYADLPRVFRDLNISFETYTNPAFYLVLPDRRVDIYSHIERAIAEIKKRFKEHSTDIITYLLKEQDIIELLLKAPISTSEHFNLKNAVNKLNTGRLLRKERQYANKILKDLWKNDLMYAFTKAIATHMFPWHYTSKTLGSVPFILQKSFYPVGGRSSIKNAIMNELTGLHVKVIHNKRIKHIEHKRHFIINLEDEQSIKSKALIMEPLYEDTLLKLPLNAFKRIKKQFYVDNIFIGLHRLCLPEVYNRVNHAVIVSDHKKELFNDNLIFIFNNPISDIRRAKNDMTALTVCTLIQETDIAKLSLIRNATLKHLKNFMPFFDEYVEKIYFTEPYVLWGNKAVPVYTNRVLLVNDEFTKGYTFDEKYAYIKTQLKRHIFNA
jgi:hypothetical protein